VTYSRRSFLKTGAALAAASVASPRRAFSADAAPPAPLEQFGYAEVELLDGPLRQQFQTNHAFYAALDEDALLKPFRQKAGLPAPGPDMGGWYDWSDDFSMKNFHGFVPGHTLGQYISGLSRDYAATRKPETQQKVQRLVSNYAAAISPNFYKGYRLPAYTYDKVSIGLIDAHEFAADPNALKALDATIDAALPPLPSGGLSRDQQFARPHTDDSYCWDEPYTLPENLFLAYKRGAGDRYLDLAKRFLADDWYFDPLANEQNVLAGKHAYSHVNALSSAAQAYLCTGSQKHLRAAHNGFSMIKAQSFATGGWGPNETLCAPGSGALGDSLTKTHSSFETPCGAYAMFKITRYLLRVTRDTRYGDSMERVLYNTILGAKPITKSGYGFYYSDYNDEGSKFYHHDKWTCCSGTFAQITADYGISAYLHDAQGGVYVNLYAPSRVSWQQRKELITLTQNTRYPFEPTTTLTVSVHKPTEIPIYLRIPEWSAFKTRITINGLKAVWRTPPPPASARPPASSFASSARGRTATASRLNSTCPPPSKLSTPSTPRSLLPSTARSPSSPSASSRPTSPAKPCSPSSRPRRAPLTGKPKPTPAPSPCAPSKPSKTSLTASTSPLKPDLCAGRREQWHSCP
jgi:DUF1680 family protein